MKTALISAENDSPVVAQVHDDGSVDIHAGRDHISLAAGEITALLALLRPSRPTGPRIMRYPLRSVESLPLRSAESVSEELTAH